MIELLITWICYTLALLFIARVIPGVSIDGFVTALWSAVAIGLINIFIRPILIILTLPINLLTLGLFTFVINALMFLLVAKIMPGFEVSGFLSALMGSTMLTILSIVINNLNL